MTWSAPRAAQDLESSFTGLTAEIRLRLIAEYWRNDMKTFQNIVSAISLVFSTAALGTMAGCSTEEPLPHADEHVGTADQALTAEQCNYFDINGRVQICHQLGNGKFSILKLSEQACINAHGTHAADYVTSTDPNSPLYDPTCNGQGCLPQGAPCDETIEPCEGLSCENGVVVSSCAPPEIVSAALAPENFQVDAATWAADNAATPDGENDGVIDLVVRGKVKSIALLFSNANGSCWQTGQWDTITGNASLLPGMSCGLYQLGSHTYGMGVSDDGGATLLNAATGDLPQLDCGLHSLKLYVPKLTAGRYYRARVQLEDGSILISPTFGYAQECAPSQTACDIACADLSSDNNNCGACGHACSGGGACVNGTCTLCSPPYTECNGECVDLYSDNYNCGECGVVCAPGELCMGFCL